MRAVYKVAHDLISEFYDIRRPGVIPSRNENEDSVLLMV
jgi:hypothetical protein